MDRPWEEQLMTDVTWSTRDIFHCPSWEHELQCYESPYVLHGTVNKSNILLRGSDKTIWKGKNRFRVLGSQNLWWEKTFDVDCISNIVSSLAVYCLVLSTEMDLTDLVHTTLATLCVQQIISIEFEIWNFLN